MTPTGDATPMRRRLQGRLRGREWGWLLAVVAATMLVTGATAAAAKPKRLPRDLFKSGQATRNAFRPVVSGPSKSTVSVLVNGRVKALGAIVGADGFILTKASELSRRPSGIVTCKLKDGQSYPARRVGLHRGHDLAMLKINAKGLPVVNWKVDVDPSVGQWLATPGTKDLPVAVGVVSIRRRAIPHLHGLLGIIFDERSPQARIAQVMPDSGASRAELKVGDVITHVGGVRVSNGPALRTRIRLYRPGEMLPLRVVRNQVEFDICARLGSPADHVPSRGTFMNKLGGQLSFRRGGFPAVFAHDTVLKPEQCGGPLVDLQGRTVGINIAREGRTESHAIPARVIVGLIEDLKAGRKFAAPITKLGGIAPPPVPLAR